MAIHRRQVIQGAVTAGAASLVASRGNGEISPPAPRMPPRVIDTNISLFSWPFRRLPLDNVDDLCSKLQQIGITEAWAGSFESLLHRDLRSVNERLINACQNHSILIPVGAVNPNLPDWRHDLELCLGHHGMPGVRLLPGYHHYELKDQAFGALLAKATELGGFVQVAMTLEDARTQSDLLRAANIDLRPLKKWMQQIPKARVQILNCRPTAADIKTFESTPRLTLDTSRVEGTDGLSNLAASIGSERLLFGSHSPFLIPEASCIRILENGLPAEMIPAIMLANAKRFCNVQDSHTEDHPRSTR